MGTSIELFERRAIFVSGIVQGVGFRPFVHRLATGLELSGFVRNRTDGVLIEVEGEPQSVASFLDQLRTHSTHLARAEAFDVVPIVPQGDRAFAIQQSEASRSVEPGFVSPDVGMCPECLTELFDPDDRRHRYPFISCARCGPRLTIVRAVPYDRERTTMAGFALCEACRAEYEDATDRRFHAQAIACATCGPQLRACDAEGRALTEEPLASFQAWLLAERTIAVKGLGGYHLACDATSQAAVERLRKRKQREEKPFAVMVADLDAARQLCHVSASEAKLLASSRAPVVLLRRRSGTAIAEAVAPRSPLLGVMLPYTPLHHLLAREAGRPFVLTSGNRSDEPIATQDHDAVARLGAIVDGFLMHDRPIQLPCDDSVARVIGDKPVLIRRSRGYAPEPIRLSLPCAQRVLALGGHLKNTFALGWGDHAVLSQHIGDLSDWTTFRSFSELVAEYETRFAFVPDALVHDLHPGYATSEYARERQTRADSSVRLLAVQHHHAHMASCMAENGITGSAIGVVFDGLGYGSDDALWGGEFLLGGYRAVRRAAHFRAVPLAGGERAVREPWRMALAHLIDADEDPERFMGEVRPEAVRIVHQMIERQLNAPLTTSVGRLFDAVASLLALRATVSFEGQAAVELEWLASTSESGATYPFALATAPGEEGLVVDVRPLVKAIAEALRRGRAPADIARAFHNTIAEIIACVAVRLRDETGLIDVVLTGGVFQNALLLTSAKSRLEKHGLRVYTHSRVPPNDAGLSLGQLAIAAAWLQGEG